MPAGKATTQLIRKCLVPMVALAVVSVAPAVATAAPAAPSHDAAPPKATGTTSTIAPVKLPGQQFARTYSPAEVRANERTGGDPAVLAYWTPKRMKAAKPLDMPGDAKFVDQTARAIAKKLPGVATEPAPSKLSSSMKNYPRRLPTFR